MSPNEQKKISKRLSYVLRHSPDSIGIVLDSAGWVSTETLLEALRTHGRQVSSEDLEVVVSENPKKRFEFDECGAKIRARQGHSVPVELGYPPVEPPEILFHGTADRFLEAILAEGLRKMGRSHVHLSTDPGTMLEVGRRHGKPVLLQIEASKMHKDGHVFHLTDNQVWLTDSVPAEYLSQTQ